MAWCRYQVSKAHGCVRSAPTCYTSACLLRRLVWGLVSIRGSHTLQFDHRCWCSGAVPRCSYARRLLETSEWPPPDVFMQEAQLCPAPLIKDIPESQVGSVRVRIVCWSPWIGRGPRCRQSARGDAWPTPASAKPTMGPSCTNDNTWSILDSFSFLSRHHFRHQDKGRQPQLEWKPASYLGQRCAAQGTLSDVGILDVWHA